jgi:rhodanese-related sulfurtransferase
VHRTPTVAVAELPADPYLLDVREPEEWAYGRVDGAVHVPMQTLPERVGDLPVDRTVFVICRSGHRSAYAAAWLGQQGVDAVNVEGGMLDWEAAGRPMVADPGVPDAPHVR